MSILLQKKNVDDYYYMSSPNIYYRAIKEQQTHFCFAALHLYYSFVLRVVSPIRVNFTSPSATPRVCCV